MGRPKVGGFASAPLTPLPHRPAQHLMRMEPLNSAPPKQPDSLSADPQLQALRQRAERALAPLRTGPASPTRSHPLACPPALSSDTYPLAMAPTAVPANVALAAAAASAPPAGGPSTEERRRR